jgi:hypothetical protein
MPRVNGPFAIPRPPLKRTSYDIIQLMRQNAVALDNDAKAAYD